MDHERKDEAAYSLITDPSIKAITQNNIINDLTSSPEVLEARPTSSSLSYKSEENSEGTVEQAVTQMNKKQQKRNKPTLSCERCVERKTKCDRGRPNCLACIKRQTIPCTYVPVAETVDGQKVSSRRKMIKPPKRKAPSSFGSGSDHTTHATSPIQHDWSASQKAGTSSSGLRLLNISQDPSLGAHGASTSPPASNVFGIGSEHPFANYWTRQGGLPEVISVFPSKDQADMLIERYFECVDPVYPMLNRQTFYADYEHFWSLAPGPARDSTDGALIAIIFVMLAMGTQFVTSTSSDERQQSAEFYVSASHQSLRMFSYLNRASIHSIQAMVLITYFLINDNHAGDGWAFAGVLLRQSYSMGLHRDPNIVTPSASLSEKQMRRKLWQAVLLQDTFLTVLLSLPPSATHTDVNVEDLVDDAASIGTESPADIAYIRGCWKLANLVQESICSPRSLDLPICSTPRQKSNLLSQFRHVSRSLPDIFRSWDAASLVASISPEPPHDEFASLDPNNGTPSPGASSTSASHLPQAPAFLPIPKNLAANRRIARQTLFLTSNYYHNLMLLHASECKEGGVPINIRGALEAAHEAIQAFFLLTELFKDEAKVWWVFNHRAFLEAMCIATILRDRRNKAGEAEWTKDSLYIKAKGDVAKMLETMQLTALGEAGHSSEVARTRLDMLSAYI